MKLKAKKFSSEKKKKIEDICMKAGFLGNKKFVTELHMVPLLLLPNFI